MLVVNLHLSKTNDSKGEEVGQSKYMLHHLVSALQLQDDENHSCASSYGLMITAHYDAEARPSAPCAPTQQTRRWAHLPAETSVTSFGMA